MIFSWPNWWALEAPAKPANDLTDGRPTDLDVPAAVQQRDNGRFLPSRTNPSSVTKPVLVPSLYLLSEQEGANLVSFVAAGGTAVISFWSGIVDEQRRRLPRPLWRARCGPLIGL